MTTTLQLVEADTVDLRPSRIFTSDFIARLSALNAAGRRLRELGFTINGEWVRMDRGCPLITLDVHPYDWQSQRLLRRFISIRCLVAEGMNRTEHGSLEGVDVCWPASPDFVGIDESATGSGL
ncbi:hypothetical protein [Pigmentiphaga kullae]|uniref:Uncharacterized protein n=1 Tax=Pigmentiphaga kullae TaxID=151784 RepID=A0A4Q7NLU3_9BURK|nr:hypothetical protein [Pigmentiphaga kullae]RZS86043.1 hypothetical protein EV675_2077 [Pigmentiphaga kullae]